MRKFYLTRHRDPLNGWYVLVKSPAGRTAYGTPYCESEIEAVRAAEAWLEGQRLLLAASDGPPRSVKSNEGVRPMNKSEVGPPATSTERPSPRTKVAPVPNTPIRHTVTATPATTAPKSGLVAAFNKSVAASLAPHLIIIARAGTGKTTSLIEGLKEMKGIKSKLTPSPQQRAIWEWMAKSRDAKTICFVAFNKSIATELQARVPAGCDAMTMHSMGLKAVTKAFGRCEINAYRVQDIISELLEVDIRILRKDQPVLLAATEELVGLVKQNLAETDRDSLDRLCSHYEVETNGCRDRVFDLVGRVIEACKDVKGKIDFNDMIWLPVALGLPLFRYDVLLVDEAQDLNRCQQELAKRSGKRLILCGDPKQAIYGFAGADADSMPRMERELPGCVVLPLTVTRRCGKAIVKEANRIVPDFDAFETNPEGKISHARYGEKTRISGSYQSEAGVKLSDAPTYHAQVQYGDMLLCRVNAPLVSQCFKFIRIGKKANIQGRDVAKGLITTVTKLSSKDEGLGVNEFVARLSDWLHAESAKEQAKRNPSEARLIAVQDRHDCLLCFTEGAKVTGDVIRKINEIFTDNKTSPGIKLSSIHKAKGLEAKRVFLLEPEGATVPHPMAKSAWQREQEMNLRYVAITRAIEELIYVS